MTVLHDRIYLGTAKWAHACFPPTPCFTFTIQSNNPRTDQYCSSQVCRGATDSDRKHRSQLCHHVVSGHRFTVTSLAYTLHTHEYMHSFQAYPPSDSNALRGEGFQLHVLRWSIRSWGHSTNINIMNCTLDPNNCLKQQHVSQHPAEQMSRCESHSAYFSKCGSCFYRWLLRLRRSALWGVGRDGRWRDRGLICQQGPASVYWL